jgi:hypothetical protein
VQHGTNPDDAGISSQTRCSPRLAIYLRHPQAAAATNNSAKAEAKLVKLVKALDYLVAINDNSDNPGQKWVINESILASLTGCSRPQPWQSQDQPGRYP